MALSDEMKQFAAELLPAIQGMVDAAVSKIPVAGAILPALVDTGVAALEAHNAKYFQPAPAAGNPGIAPVVPTANPNQTPTQQAVALAMGNAPLAPAVPQVAPADPSTHSLEGAYNLIAGLAAKVEALSAATGLQTSAAMAAHAPMVAA